MDAASRKTTARWLSEGLERLAAGERAAAADCWRRVLEREPGHRTARDYLASLGEPTPSGSDADPDETEGPTAAEIRGEVLELVAGGLIDEAYELLTTAGGPGAMDLESLGLLELLRAHLHEDVLRRFGSPRSVPVVEMAPEDLMKFNLPAGAGFLLSRIDGVTPLEDLMAVSALDPFDTMHTLGRLLEAGIVGVGG